MVGAKIKYLVKQEAKQDVFRPASEVVNDVLLSERTDAPCPCLPHVDSLLRTANRTRQQLRPQEQIYRQHENGKKDSYAKRVMEIEQGTFTPLVFSTTAGLAEECRWYHSRLAELLAIKKGKTTPRLSLGSEPKSLLQLLCLRGLRTIKGRNNLDMGDADLDVEKTEARIH